MCCWLKDTLFCGKNIDPNKNDNETYYKQKSYCSKKLSFSFSFFFSFSFPSFSFFCSFSRSFSFSYSFSFSVSPSPFPFQFLSPSFPLWFSSMFSIINMKHILLNYKTNNDTSHNLIKIFQQICDVKNQICGLYTFAYHISNLFDVDKPVLNQSFKDIISYTVSIYIIRDHFIRRRGCYGANHVNEITINYSDVSCKFVWGITE